MLNPGAYKGTYEIESGIPCLDFANTLSWRLSDQRHEWLDGYENLLEWGLVAGVIQADETVVTKLPTRETLSETNRVLDRVIHLREAIYRIFSATSDGQHPQTEDIQTLNAEMYKSSKHLGVAWSGSRFAWHWKDGTPIHDKIMGAVVRSAVELLTSDDLERVGECQGVGCGWLFVDTSKNHTRRWCSMNDCGNRAKARKHYQRHKVRAAQS